MPKFVLPGLITAAAVALLLLLAFGISRSSDSSSIDAQVAKGAYPRAPDDNTRLPMLGSDVSTDLKAFRGKVVVLNVFASWCDPCQTEAPLLAREQRMLSTHDATVLGVTYKDAESATERFDRRYGITYPVVRDVSGAFAKAFGANGVPETFVINRSGKIQALRRFPVTKQWLDRTLPPILAEKA